MTTVKQSPGRWGEELAANYLIENGYTIVARNYYTKHGELDIIAQMDDLIFIVEVKLARTIHLVSPKNQLHQGNDHI